MWSRDDVVPAKNSNDVFILAHIMKQYKKLHCCQIVKNTPPKVEKSLRSIKNDWTHKVDVVDSVLNQQREDLTLNSFSNEKNLH